MNIGDIAPPIEAGQDHINEAYSQTGFPESIPSDELNALRVQFGDLWNERRTLKGDRKHINARLKEIESDLDDMSVQAQSGERITPREVIERRDHRSNEVAYLDPDTRKVLKVRTMDAEEAAQDNLPTEPPKPTRRGRGKGKAKDTQPAQDASGANGSGEAQASEPTPYDFTHRCSNCQATWSEQPGFDPTKVQECPNCHQHMGNAVTRVQPDTEPVPEMGSEA